VGSLSSGATAHFRSARAPSAPFLIALLLGILGVIVFTLSASALFIFAIGVALAFFPVPLRVVGSEPPPATGTLADLLADELGSDVTTGVVFSHIDEASSPPR
jgi:hypothetical protein